MIFILLILISYKLTDYYVYVLEDILFSIVYIFFLSLRSSLIDANKPPKCWPNLLLLFEPTKVLNRTKKFLIDYLIFHMVIFAFFFVGFRKRIKTKARVIKYI